MCLKNNICVQKFAKICIGLQPEERRKNLFLTAKQLKLKVDDNFGDGQISIKVDITETSYNKSIEDDLY